jgi:hypothetical protein
MGSDRLTVNNKIKGEVMAPSAEAKIEEAKRA